MSFADTLFAALTVARNAAGGKLPREQWSAIVNAAFESECKARKPAKPKPASKMTDAEWLESLEAEPSLKGVDVKRELGKAEFWIKHNAGRKFTRKFFLSWLSKAERTITESGAGRSSVKRAIPSIHAEPDNWLPAAKKLFGEFAANELRTKATVDGWRSLDPHYRTKIVEALL